MEEEVRGLLRRGWWQAEAGLGLRAWRSAGGHAPVLLAITGVGRQAAQKGAELLLSGQRPAALVSLGFAGGLDPALRPGDLVLGESVQRHSRAKSGAKPVLSDVALLALAQDAAMACSLRVHRGEWLTVESAVTSREEKHRLWQETGALAVEMESYWLGDAAQRAGVPFVGVRAIVDTAHAGLPKAVLPAVMGRLVVGLARRPQDLPAVLGLARSVAKGRRSLTQFMGIFWSEFARRTASAPLEG